MFVFVDRLSELCGRLAGWLFVLIGGMIVYEVVARYVFLSPTIWAEELSRFVQIWATCLAGAWVLRHRHLIAIDVGLRRLKPPVRLCVEVATLLFITVFCAVTVVKAIPIAVDSIALGRKSATMLEVPLWLSEIAVPIGFSILLLQALTEAVRLVLRGKEGVGVGGR